jgi:hypothetical protein
MKGVTQNNVSPRFIYDDWFLFETLIFLAFDFSTCKADINQSYKKSAK